MDPASWSSRTAAGFAVGAFGTRCPTAPFLHSGVYLLAHDPGPFEWRHRWVHWRDFRVPASTDAAALQEAFDRSETERVEVACNGGVGRTGTALAAMAVLAGVPAPEAVDWVRRNYHRRAVETPWQRRWVAKVEAGR